MIDRSITQAHLQILQSARPDPVRGVSWPFPTGTRPIIEIPTESSRGSCADFCEFPRFFSYNACLPSKRRQKTAYFHIVHNQSTHFFLFRRHFFSIPPKMQSRRPLETAPGRPKAPLGGAPPSFDALSGPHLYRHLYRDAVLDAVPADGAVLCLEPPPVPCPIGLCPKIFCAGLPGGLEPFPSFCNKFTSRSFVLTRTVRQKGPRLAGQGTRRACGVSRLF